MADASAVGSFTELFHWCDRQLLDVKIHGFAKCSIADIFAKLKQVGIEGPQRLVEQRFCDDGTEEPEYLLSRVRSFSEERMITAASGIGEIPAGWKPPYPRAPIRNLDDLEVFVAGQLAQLRRSGPSLGSEGWWALWNAHNAADILSLANPPDFPSETQTVEEACDGLSRLLRAIRKGEQPATDRGHLDTPSKPVPPGSAIRRLLNAVLHERDQILAASEHDALLLMLAQRIPRQRPKRIRTDRESVDFIRAVRRMWNEGGCYPSGRTRPLYSECHKTGGAFDRLRRGALAEVGHLAAAPALLPLLKQLESARAAFLDVAMRRAENDAGDLTTATVKLNEAWVTVEADILPIVEAQVAFPSQPTAAPPKCHGETELLSWLVDAQIDDQAGIDLVDLPDALRSPTLLTACDAKGLIEFGRRKHCFTGDGRLILEWGYEFDTLNKPNRKSVRQLVRDAIEDNGPKEIAIRVRLTNQGHAEAACASLSPVGAPPQTGPILQKNGIMADGLEALFNCLYSAILAGGRHLAAARRAPAPTRRLREPEASEHLMRKVIQTGDDFLNKLKAIELADLSVMPKAWGRGLLYLVDHAQRSSIQDGWCFGRDQSVLVQSLESLDGYRKEVEIELRLLMPATGVPNEPDTPPSTAVAARDPVESPASLNTNWVHTPAEKRPDRFQHGPVVASRDALGFAIRSPAQRGNKSEQAHRDYLKNHGKRLCEGLYVVEATDSSPLEVWFEDRDRYFAFDGAVKSYQEHKLAKADTSARKKKGTKRASVPKRRS